MKLVNPTGRHIRNDMMGLGRYRAPRRGRLHKGLDLACTPGQEVLSPIDGFVTRVRIPYANDDDYKGLEIVGPEWTVCLFYLQPAPGIIKQHVEAGFVIGTAQDISLKYGNAMTPHIHLQIEGADPAPFIDFEPRVPVDVVPG